MMRHRPQYRQGGTRRQPIERLDETEETVSQGDETSEAPVTSEEMVKEESPETKWASFKVRLFWTLVLIFSFFGILAAGHFYCGILVMVRDLTKVILTTHS
eukprot:Protomagalhaensia_sp_Gyna_25__5853@NODE_877_length_2481_cov_19_479115_g691_i0_p5_GENE_NODE_877_length_2481_cov_19_479115_g691_i0NODE_877_length_2481_cov_19_479115_g691_i0_p5_ORF_typecomplete_len101_score12_09_NODE_877_length_2481_cov_19_479115_g691_i068370